MFGYLLKFIYIVALMVGFSACGGGSSVSTSSSSAGGAAQKGPFVQGSTVTAYKLDNGVRGISSSTQTTDNLGSFTLNSISWSGATEVVITGNYYNEVTGTTSTAPATLSAVINVKAGEKVSANINFLTDLAAKNIKETLKNSDFGIVEAKIIARKKVKDLFDIPIADDVDLEDLNITDGTGANKAANAALLRVSAAILETNSTNPESVMQDLADDMADGVIDSKINLFDKLKTNANDVNMTTVSQNMESKLGISGTPNAADIDDTNPSWMQTNTAPTITKGTEGSKFVLINREDAKLKFTISDTEQSLSDLNVSGRCRLNTTEEKYGYLSNINIDTTSGVVTADMAYAHDTNYFEENTEVPCSVVVSDGEYATKKDFNLIWKTDARLMEGEASNTPNYDTNVTISFSQSSDKFAFTEVTPSWYDYPFTSYSITNKPSWADFNTSTGLLSASVDDTHAGTFSNITIIGCNSVGCQSQTFNLTLEAPDKTPNSFSFSNATDVDINLANLTSGAVQITGIDANATISIVGGEYSVTGSTGTYVTTDGSVAPDGYITLKAPSISTYSTTANVVLTVGGVSSTWSITTKANPVVSDTTPDAFHFADVTDVDTNTVQEASFIVSGINQASTISVVGGEYKIDKKTNYSSTPSTVESGDKIFVRHTSSSYYLTKVDTTLSIGGVSDTFSSTTKQISTPNLSGTATSTLPWGTTYSFTPSNSGGDVTTWSITNKPSWTSFDTSSGVLSGTPAIGDIGTISDINITATNAGGSSSIGIAQVEVTNKTAPEIMSGNAKNLGMATLDYTFTDDPDWRAAVTAVKYGSNYGSNDDLPAIETLTSSDYTFGSGSFKINVETSTNVLVHTPIDGGGVIKILATGYNDTEILTDIITDGTYGIKAELQAHDDNTPITESNLNAAKIGITLINQLKFADNALDSNNFSLIDAPTGTTIASVEYFNDSYALVTLAFDGTDYDTNASMNIQIESNELNANVSKVSNAITIEAIIEAPSSGQAVDPYIVGAQFWADVNGDGIQDANELSTLSDVNGSFDFTINVPDDTNVTMIKQGLHNGKPFDGNISAQFKASRNGIISPITSLGSIGFSDTEIITLLTSNGMTASEFNTTISPEELYMDPFSTALLPLDGNMSGYSDAQIQKFRRVLLANVAINSALTIQGGYDMNKTAMNENFFASSDASPSPLAMMMTAGISALDFNFLKTGHARIIARIFVTVSNYVRDKVAAKWPDRGDMSTELTTQMTTYIPNMITELSQVYPLAYQEGLTDPKFGWVSGAPMLFIQANELGNKDVTITYNSNDIRKTVTFASANHTYSENNSDVGNWQVVDGNLTASDGESGKQFELLGDTIKINGISYNVIDVMYNNTDFLE